MDWTVNKLIWITQLSPCKLKHKFFIWVFDSPWLMTMSLCVCKRLKCYKIPICCKLIFFHDNCNVCLYAGLRWCFSWRRAAACVHSGDVSGACYFRPLSARHPWDYRWTTVATTGSSSRQPCPANQLTGNWVIGSGVAGNQLPVTRMCPTLQQWFLWDTWMIMTIQKCTPASFLTRRSTPRSVVVYCSESAYLFEAHKIFLASFERPLWSA